MVGDFLIDIHRHQLGLVKAGLKFVGNQHYPVFRAVKSKAQILPLYLRVHILLCEFLVFIHDEYIIFESIVILMHDLFASHLARERNQ